MRLSYGNVVAVSRAHALAAASTRTPWRTRSSPCPPVAQQMSIRPGRSTPVALSARRRRRSIVALADEQMACMRRVRNYSVMLTRRASKSYMSCFRSAPKPAQRSHAWGSAATGLFCSVVNVDATLLRSFRTSPCYLKVSDLGPLFGSRASAVPFPFLKSGGEYHKTYVGRPASAPASPQLILCDLDLCKCHPLERRKP